MEELSNHIFSNSINLKDYPKLQILLENLIDNQKKLNNVNFLLEKYCPLNDEKELESEFILNTQTDQKDDDVSSYSNGYMYLMKQDSSYLQVTNFIKSVLKKLIPMHDFFGSDENIFEFERKLEIFISMKKFETFSLDFILKNLKLKYINWGKMHKDIKEDFEIQTKLMKHFVNFVFNDIVIFIVKKYFYCTETSYNRKTILYFRRNIWNQSMFFPSFTHVSLRYCKKYIGE
jgi:hypothetical protein